MALSEDALRFARTRPPRSTATPTTGWPLTICWSVGTSAWAPPLAERRMALRAGPRGILITLTQIFRRKTTAAKVSSGWVPMRRPSAVTMTTMTTWR